MQANTSSLFVGTDAFGSSLAYSEPKGHPRRGQRTDVAQVRARFVDDDEDMVFDGLRLSPTGLFLRSALLFELGEELVLEIQPPHRGSIYAEARVVDVSLPDEELGGEADESGMMVSFTYISPPDLRRLLGQGV